MISTLRSANSFNAKVSSLSIQAISNVVTETRQSATADALISFPSVVKSSVSMQTKASSTISAVAKSLFSNDRVFLTPISKYNRVMPTAALHLDASKIFDPRVTQGFVNTTTKFQPYEQLTGIAHERPEIVMMTNFVPLFNKGTNTSKSRHVIGQHEDDSVVENMTTAGEFFDTQIQMRNLRSFNTQKVIYATRHYHDGLNAAYYTRQNDFKEATSRLKADANFMLNLVRIVETQKMQLDLRHDLYIVDPKERVKIDPPKSQAPAPGGQPQGLVLYQTVWTTYSPVDSLVNLGFNKDNVKNIFSSTKIWMQLLIELKNSLKTHTLQFLDIDPSQQRNDNNATTLLDPDVKRFSISTNLPGLPHVDELIELQPGNVAKAINLFAPAFQTIYQDVFFKNEEARCAALAHLISKEYRYSLGLSLPEVQRPLAEYYGFQVEPSGNTTVFDSVLGKFGDNITDFSATSDSSLVTVAQNTFVSNDVPTGVLTFETKYVDGDTGTLTPGGDFYFDSLFDPIANPDGTPAFNTKAIETLTQKLESSAKSFSTIVDGMNLAVKPEPSAGRKALYTPSFVEANVTLKSITDRLVDSTGNALSAVKSDRLGAVYTYAKTNPRIKTILFLYAMCKISRSYGVNIPFLASSTSQDNTAVCDALIEQLISSLELAMPATASSLNQFKAAARGVTHSALTSESIRAALKSGTSLTTVVEGFMSNVISQFRVKTTAIHDGFTRYSGYIDTVIMMVAFDLVTSLIARYSNQKMVGSYHETLSSVTRVAGQVAFAKAVFKTTLTTGPFTFAISRNSLNHKTSVNELLSRSAGEDARVKQTISTVSYVLSTLKGSLTGIVNFLKSPTSLERLKIISQALNNDPTMLRMVFNEQQIMMLSATVEDLVTATAALDPESAVYVGPANVAPGEESLQEMAVLDESAVSENLRKALLGYFKTPDYASTVASNKKILTVGIPLGHVQRMKQRVNTQNQKRVSFQNHRNDIVSIVIYKVDVQNADVVYKPQRFLFELSRFPVRIADALWKTLPAVPSLRDVVNSIPTQNFSQNPDKGTADSLSSGLEYAPTFRSFTPHPAGTRLAFEGSTYDFLTNQQKDEILKNHVSSQLLESYVKLMTGINVAEYNYEMTEAPQPVDNAFVKLLTENTIKYVAEVVENKQTTTLNNSLHSVGILFASTASKSKFSSASRTASSVSASSQFLALKPSFVSAKSSEKVLATVDIDRFLDVIRPSHKPAVISHVKAVADFTNTFSSLANVNALNHKILMPKQFDRVFNIVIDPGMFEIDVEKTTVTTYGKDAFDLMVQNGDILAQSENSQYDNRVAHDVDTPPGFRPLIPGRSPPNVNSFALRARDKNEGDLISDKYFVTIETFGEDEV